MFSKSVVGPQRLRDPKHRPSKAFGITRHQTPARHPSHLPALDMSSDDEGGSGPSGASNPSSAFRLDPADNESNQVTAPFGANVNNIDTVSLADTFIGAMASPTASHATEEPVWPTTTGGTTALEAYLASMSLVDTAQIPGDDAADAGGTISSSPPTAGPPTSSAAASSTTVENPPDTGAAPQPEGPPTPGATRTRANKIAQDRAADDTVLPTATGATASVSQMAEQFDTQAPAYLGEDPTDEPPASGEPLSQSSGMQPVGLANPPPPSPRETQAGSSSSGAKPKSVWPDFPVPQRLGSGATRHELPAIPPNSSSNSSGQGSGGKPHARSPRRRPAGARTGPWQGQRQGK